MRGKAPIVSSEVARSLVVWRFWLKRIAIATRLRAKLHEGKEQIKRRRYELL